MEERVVEAPQLKRRHLLAGGLGALLAGALSLPGKAKAVSQEFLLGGRNVIDTTTIIEVTTAGATAFEALSPAGGIGLLGLTGISDVSNPNNIQAGVWAAGMNGGYGAWAQSTGKPGLIAISDQIGSLAIQGDYADAPAQREIMAGAWNYSKAHFGAWNQSESGIGSLSVSNKAIGALNIAGMYGDLPAVEGIQAGAWNYSKGYI